MRIGVALASLLVASRAWAASPCDADGEVPIARVEVRGIVDAPADEVRGAVADAVGIEALEIAGQPVEFRLGPLALARIETAVLDTGWFESATAVFAADAEVCLLRVRVREFTPVQEIRIPGIRAYEPKTLLPLLETKVGAKPNRKTLEKDGERIAAKYREDGYEAARLLQADVDGSVVTFRVGEGRIARIEVLGAKRTRPKRVRKVLGIRPGDLYNSRALVDGQAALYRTGLFSLVGFGVEPVGGQESEELVLTVTVGELTAPYSRTEVFADRDASWTTVDARLRNVGAGHSARLALGLYGVSPADLAGEGFDEYYVARGTAELRLFRPDPTTAGARLALEAERVHGRERTDLGIREHLDLPSARVTGDIPVLSARGWSGVGTVTAQLGWRSSEAAPELGAPDEESGAWGRGEVGLELSRIAGIDVPAAVNGRAGVEIHAGWRPFSYLAADARAALPLWRTIRMEARADARTLSGREVPWFRETVLTGTPLGQGRDYGFARHHARGEIAVIAALPRDLFGVSAGWQGAAWSGAGGARGTHDAQALSVEARLGPEFARLRAGVAAPLPGATARAPWWFAALVVATPY